MLVAGIDSSTQSCKVVVRDARSGTLVRQGRARHPEGTEVDPAAWAHALDTAVGAAGGLDDVDAVSVAGQQHGMVCLDERGEVVRPALLWNDTRNAGDCSDLVDELGAEAWAQAVGTVPVPSLTVGKLRWLARHEPDHAARTEAVCLPHDWLTWRLRGTRELDDLVTDRSDASGTGYFDARTGDYRRDLLVRALGHDARLPRVAAPDELVAGRWAAGAGDNAASLLGIGAGTDTLVSLGTSGVVTTRHEEQTADPTGIVAGFADATGAFLPLVCTLNAARVLEAVARLLGVDLDRLSELALAAPPGAEGLVVVPYLEGERTPNLPWASGAVHGLTNANARPETIARAAVEGMLCGLAAGLDALASHGIASEAVCLVGGAAASPAVREIAPTVFGVPVTVPAPGEYVANGAARQAAWGLLGELPGWEPAEAPLVVEGAATPGLRERYADAAAHVVARQAR